MLIILTIVITAATIIVLLNFMTAEKKIQRKLESLYDVADAQFSRSISALLGPPFVSGNDVQVLTNGNEIFLAMLSAIKSAQETITFETFIYWADSIGDEFTNALGERAQTGVKVHVLLDWLGSAKMEERQLNKMKLAGV